MEVDIIQDPERAALASLGCLLGLALLWVLSSFIGAFVVALFFYYAARPIHTRLKQRMHDSLSAALSLIALIFPVLILMIYVLSIGVRELFFFLSNVESEQFKQFISPYINYQLLIDIQNSIASAQYGELLSQQGASFVSQTSGILLDYFGILGGGLINSFIVIVVSYYLLKDGEKFVTKLSERFDVSPIVHKFISNIDSDFQTIFFGNLLNALLTASIGIFSFLLLELFFVPSPALSIKYPVLIGLLCGIGSLIPIVGMKIVYFPVALYIGFQSFRLPGVSPLYPIIFFSVSAVIVDGIPDLVLRPYISSGDLHLGLVMLSYIIGPLLFGWYGLFFGPMLLVIITHFSITIIPYLINKNRTLSEFN